MTNKPTNDRSYYRMLDDDELIELAKSVETTELSLVLAERLKKARLKFDYSSDEE